VDIFTTQIFITNKQNHYKNPDQTHYTDPKKSKNAQAFFSFPNNAKILRADRRGQF
jgi:hypothetical protein